MLQRVPCREWLSAPPDAPLFFKGGRPVRASELSALVAGRFAAVKAADFERIVIRAADALDFTASLLAVLHAGRCAVLPGSHRLSTRAVRREAEAVLGGDEPLEGLPLLKAEKETSRTGSVPPSLPPIPASARILLFTSGSTGEPKAVVKTPEMMDREAEMTAGLFGGKLLGCVAAGSVDPLHMFGLSFLVWLPLSLRIPVRAERIQVPEDLAAAGEAGRPLALITTPTFLKYLDSALEPPAIRFALTAGGALSRETAQRFREWAGIWPAEIYGSTENGVVASRIASDPPGEALLVPPLSFDRAGGEGAILSPIVSGGRAKLDDRIEVTGERSFRLLGRKDRIVKVAEHRVSLAEVERALAALGWPGVALLLDKDGRESVGFVIDAERTALACSPGPAALRSLKAELRRRLPAFAVPRYFRGPCRLPRNSQGKIDLVLLKELFDDRRKEAAP